MKKSLFVTILFALACLWGCAVNLPHTSSGVSDISSEGVATLTVELDAGQDNTKSVIEVEELDIIGATIALSNSLGEGEVKTWKPGDPFVFTFQVKRTGLHTLTVTDWDEAGHTNIATKQINIRNGKNYRVKVQLGGVIYIEPVEGEIPRDGLVAEYLFNGNALDTSGNGNNATNVTAILTTDRFGNQDRAYDFSDGGMIVVPDSPSLNPSKEITISCFAKLERAPAPYTYENCILRKAYNMDAGYIFSMGSSDIELRLDGPGLNGSVVLIYKGSGSLVGSWHHIAASYSSLTKEGKIYLDGNLIMKTNNVSYSFTNTGKFLTIGTRYYDPWFFPGSIDNLRIYNRVLSDEEIKALYEESE